MHEDLIPEKIYVYRNDVVVRRTPLYPMSEEHKRKLASAVRGDITEFSFQSRRKLAFVAANTDIEFGCMVTLTYPAEWPTDGKQVKANLRSFLQQLRRWFGKVSYLWFMEFQRRGAPHFHICLSVDYDAVDKESVSRRWYEIVASGDRRHLRAGTNVRKSYGRGGAARYAVKYALKMRQKQVPTGYRNCGRFWGHSRDVAPRLRAVHGVWSQRELDILTMRWVKDKKCSNDFKYLFGAAPYIAEWTGIDYESEV